MPSVQEIYNTLVKDPNFEVGEHQTREEAAQSEAEFRSRQHWNNVRALSLANEPLKKESSIKALLNHVASITKTVVSGSISIAQNILKEKQSVSSLVEGYGKQSFFDLYPTYNSQFNDLPPLAQQFFKILEQSGMPTGDLIKAFSSIHSVYQSETNNFTEQTVDEEGSGIDPEDDSWVHDMVEAVTEEQGAGSFASTLGIGAQYINKIHTALSNHKDFKYAVAAKGAFKETSYKSDLAESGFYGKNTKSDLTKVATLEDINNALEKAGFPHRVNFGGNNKLKLTTVSGGNIPEGMYHNPFPQSSHGRLYTSMVDGNSPQSAQDNIDFNNLEDFSVADILNSIHWLTQQASPDQQKSYNNAKQQVEDDFEAADKAEQKTLTLNPSKATNQAGSSPNAAKSSGKSAHDSPHVIMGAMFGPPTSGQGLAFSKALEYGLCDEKGRVNKIGQVLLQSMYKDGKLNNQHVFQVATHSVLKAPGIKHLMEHHGIDVVHGKVMAKAVAENIAGKALAFEDMPEGIDWEDLAKQVAGEIPVGGADETSYEVVEQAVKETGVKVEPLTEGNPLESYQSKAEGHAIRLNSAMHSGNEDAINMAFGKVEGFIGSLEEPDTLSTGISTNNIHKLILDGIDPPNQSYFSDLANALDSDGAGVSDFQEAVKAGTAFFKGTPSSAEEGLPTEPWEHHQKIGEAVAEYVDKKGTGAKQEAIDNVHQAMKNAKEQGGLSHKEINQLVSNNLIDTSEINLLADSAALSKTLEDKAKKLHSIHEHDYTGSGLSDDEIQAEQDQASQEFKEALLDLGKQLVVEGEDPKKAMSAAKIHIQENLDANNQDISAEDWLASKNIEGAAAFQAEDIKPDPSVPKELIPNKLTLQNHVSKKAQNYTDQIGTDTEQQALDALHNALETVTNPTNKHITPLSAKEANDAVKDTLTDYSGVTLLDEKDDAQKEAVPVDKAIGDLLDKNKDVVEHTYNQTYGKDNPVVSLEDFTDDLKEKYSEMGEKKAKHEMAVAYKKQADFLAQEEQKETKAQEVEDAKATAKEEKQAEQEVKEQEKLEAQKNKEEIADAKAADKASNAQAKAAAKDIEKNANSLPSDPGDLGQIAQEMGDDDAGEPLATQHARELMAHLKKYDKDMSPEIKKKLMKALNEADKHGADFDTIEKEMNELGDDFGSPEHLKDAYKQAVQKAEFHQNHKELVSGTDPASVQARAEAMAHGKHDKFTEFDLEDGHPIKDEGEEDEPDAVKHHVLHSLTPIQQKHVDEMKEAKASGDEEGYKKAVKALEDSGVPLQDIEHSGDDAPKTGPPDPEVAKKKMAEGYVWHEETRSWILKKTLQELQGMHTGGASGLVGGAYGGSQNKFDLQTGAPIPHKPFAANEDGTPSTKNFFHNSDGHLMGLGDGKHTGGGAVSSSKLNQDAMGHKFNESGHSQALKNSPSGYVEVDAKPPPPPKKGFFANLKDEYQAGKQSKLGAKDTFLGRFKELNKEYPMPNGTALDYFIVGLQDLQKEYGTGDHLKSNHKIRDLVERLEEENKKKSVESSIIT